MTKPSKKRVRERTPHEQVEWCRAQLNTVFRMACRHRVRGWVVGAAFQGFLQRMEHELNKKGPLDPMDYRRVTGLEWDASRDGETPEQRLHRQRSEASKRGWETRRKNKARE